MDYSLPGSSVHGTSQARVLEWVAISFSRGSSQPRDRTPVSSIVDRCFTVWATREVDYSASLVAQIVKNLLYLWVNHRLGGIFQGTSGLVHSTNLVCILDLFAVMTPCTFSIFTITFIFILFSNLWSLLLVICPIRLFKEPNLAFIYFLLD